MPGNSVTIRAQKKGPFLHVQSHEAVGLTQNVSQRRALGCSAAWGCRQQPALSRKVERRSRLRGRGAGKEGEAGGLIMQTARELSTVIHAWAPAELARQGRRCMICKWHVAGSARASCLEGIGWIRVQGLEKKPSVFGAAHLSASSPGRSKGYSQKSMTYSMTPQLHTSACWPL